MTEIKWGLLYTALFLVWVFGLEYRIVLMKQLSLTKIQYNMQLDACLRDTLEEASFFQDGGRFSFQNPEAVLKELKRQMDFDFAVWGSEEVEQGILMLALFEEDGFYYYSYGMEKVSEKKIFESWEQEEKISQMERFMEEKIGELFQKKGKSGGLLFTFPKNEANQWAQTIQGTGLLLVYEAPAQFFQGNPYERFLLSGARVEEK